MDSRLTNLAPANGPNAIVSAAFAIELDSPAADASLIAGFSGLAPQMTKDGFDPPAPQMMFTVSVGPVASSTQELGGYTYARKNTAGQPVR